MIGMEYKIGRLIHDIIMVSMHELGTGQWINTIYAENGSIVMRDFETLSLKESSGKTLMYIPLKNVTIFKDSEEEFGHFIIGRDDTKYNTAMSDAAEYEEDCGDDYKDYYEEDCEE